MGNFIASSIAIASHISGYGVFVWMVLNAS